MADTPRGQERVASMAETMTGAKVIEVGPFLISALINEDCGP